jgi:hypothetical protein
MYELAQKVIQKNTKNEIEIIASKGFTSYTWERT